MRRLLRVALASSALVVVVAAAIFFFYPPLVARWRRAWCQHWSHIDDPERDSEPRTLQILAALDVKPGMRVADIGAGVGYFTYKLAPLVGSAGRIFATDADGFAVAALWANRWRRGGSSVRPIQTGYQEVEIPDGPLDRILMVNVYPFLRCRPARTKRFMTRASQVLVSGGRLVIYQDWVHDAHWVGSSSPCGQPTGAELASRLPPELSLLELTPAPGSPKSRVPGESVGYLLVASRRDAPSLVGDSTDDSDDDSPSSAPRGQTIRSTHVLPERTSRL